MRRVYGVILLFAFVALLMGVGLASDLKIKAGYLYDLRDDIKRGMVLQGPYFNLRYKDWKFIALYREGERKGLEVKVRELKLFYQIHKNLFLGLDDKIKYRRDPLGREKGLHAFGYALNYNVPFKVGRNRLKLSFIYYYFPKYDLISGSGRGPLYQNKLVVFLSFPISKTTSISVGHKWITQVKGGRRNRKSWTAFKLNLKLKF